MNTHWRPHIRSRHPSHNPLRRVYNNLPYLPFKSLIRLGSTTPLSERYTKGRIELNTVEAIKNSSNKLLMKKCFTNNNVKTAGWWTYDGIFLYCTQGDHYLWDIKDLPYPIISKHIFGSRGTGNKKHNSAEELKIWLGTKDNLDNYIFEKYYNYNREYRLHVSENGCFYTCRKMLKTEAPQEVRWYRNDDYCVWIMEENESFDKPVNWDDIVVESVKALNAVGLDFGAIDLRIQSAKDRHGELRENPEFIVVEINSAPSLGEETMKRYIKELPNLLKKKYEREVNNIRP